MSEFDPREAAATGPPAGTPRSETGPAATEPRTVSASLLRPFILLATPALVIAGLYWLQAVLIPIALAMLLTFLLSPVVGALQRWMGRVPAVCVVVLVTLVALGGVGWVVTRQLIGLADELPRYSQNLRQKVTDLRGASTGGPVEKVQRTVQEVVGEIQKSDEPRAPQDKPVEVVLAAPSLLAHLPTLLTTLASAAVVTVLVISMLLEWVDLRDRLIRLIGYREVTVTTKALHEAGERVSRYLLMHAIVNGSFGVAVGLGLFALGLPYALLWGVLAALLRFVPYLGPWLAALLPLALSLAVFPGWVRPALLVGLIVFLELGSNLIMEPWLYGQSAGVSQVALLVAVTFWTWLWGPVGLVLATPLTVCLIVVSKYLPALGFFVTLMGDEPVLDVKARYYQRLLARDQDEAAKIAEEYVEKGGGETVYDEVLLPALYFGRQDRDRGRLAEPDLQFVVRTTRDVVDQLASDLAPQTESASGGDFPAPVSVAGCPARDEIDALALDMVRRGLDLDRVQFQPLAPALLAAEVVAWIDVHRPAVLCIGAVAPGGFSQSRYLCKRLRERFPALRIVVGRWGLHAEQEAEAQALRAAGANEVTATVLETQRTLGQLGLLLHRPDSASRQPAAAAPVSAGTSAAA